MHDDLRVAVVTGGNRGIGASITEGLVGAGYRVFVGSRSVPESSMDRVTHVPCDVRELDSIAHLAETAASAGSIDLWVNCAGFSGWRPVAEADEAFWDDMIDTNLKGTFFGCREAAARMPGGGCIINISSLAGRRGSANNSVYCASKFGVTGLTQALAKELGAAGVRVNAVCPVYVRTEGLMEALEDPRSPAGDADVDAYLRDFGDQQAALGRLPEGSEVAATVVWLASDAASAITGQSLNVDCGVMPI